MLLLRARILHYRGYDQSFGVQGRLGFRFYYRAYGSRHALGMACPGSAHEPISLASGLRGLYASSHCERSERDARKDPIRAVRV